MSENSFQMDDGWLVYHPDPSKPDFPVPEGAVDAHCHVFGPGEIFPYAPARKYTPCDASKEKLWALRDHLGFERNVIVQATCHGADNRALVDALEDSQGRARGVATVTRDIRDDELQKLHTAGVRGVRFNFVKRLVDVLPRDTLVEMAERLKPFGWHLVIYVESQDLPELSDFFVAALWLPVMIEEAVPVLLAAVATGAPPEKADHVRAARDGLVGPQSHLAWRRGGGIGAPAARAGGLFHHPHRLALEAAHQRVRQRRRGIAAPVGPEERIVVPRDHIQVGRKAVIVDLGKEPHQVVRHRASRRVAADHFYLLALKGDLHVGRVTVEIEHQAGVGAVVGGAIGGVARGINLVKAVVLLAPKGGAPGGVERVDIVVETLAQPVLKADLAVPAVAAHRAVAAKFVVGLPAHHVRVVAQRAHHLFRNAPRVLAIAGVVLARVLPLAKLYNRAVALDLVQVGMFGVQPGRIGRRGRAEDGLDAIPGIQVDRPAQPVKLELALHRLHAVPGKLAHPHPRDTCLLHQTGVGLPALLGPVLGIVRCSQYHHVLPIPETGLLGKNPVSLLAHIDLL